MSIRWGIIGPGAIAHNFATGLSEQTAGVLTAIAGRDAGRRDAFGDRFNVAPAKRYADHAALLAAPEIDAVYISTPHPFHAQLSIAALRAGKAVLCEKPGGMNAAEVTAVTEVAEQEGRLWAEAFMYRCHPQIARAVEIIRSGEIGEVTHIRTAFGFNAPHNPASRLYDPALGGGGILDVGGYPVSLARLFVGVAAGRPFADPVTVKGSGLLTPEGVDKVAYGLLVFDGSVTAEIACAVARTMDNSATVTGTKGQIVLADPWVPGRNAGPSTTALHVTVSGQTRTETLGDARMLFAFEAETISRAIENGDKDAPSPALSRADSIGNNTTLDRWRAELGYVTAAERVVPVRLAGVVPTLPPMPTATLPGVDTPVSQLILGCDNRNTLAEGALLFDAWADAGGTAFDTGHIYGSGLHEKVLGAWLAARGMGDQATIIVKGAHTPYCVPDAIGVQLGISLDRLGIARAPIYILHRDNPAVPVGEFVEAVNTEIRAGRIGVWGGSNWSPARLAEAATYAKAQDLTPPTILNNNLSLAVMEREVWAGCVTSNTAETLAFLRGGGATHVSWSSQARGYFLPEGLRNRLPADTAPETCFGSPANAERRRRAEALAAEHGVSAHNIATAWVLSQDFPSFALIGPRSPGEIASTLPGAALRLSASDCAWLNLESDSR